MKKRMLAILLTVILTFSMLPVVAVAEEEPAHIHCLCGSVKTENTVCANCGSEAVVWTQITEISTDMQEGYYYLGDTISKTVSRAISHDVSLCLNGHNIETAGEGAFAPQKGATVTLTDCDADDTTGLITGTTAKAAIAVVAGATFKMYGGTITGNTNGSANGAGIIWLQNGTATEDGGAFYMYGGKIAGNTTKRGAVFAEFPTVGNKPAIIQLLGGEITGNTGTNNGIHTGGGAGVYAAVNVVVGGDMKVYGNIGSVTAEPVPNADIYLRNDNAAYSGQLVVSADVPLTHGANIHYGSKPVETDETNLLNITGTPATWYNTWVTYDGQKVGYEDGEFFVDNSPPDTHVHCLCGAETAKGTICANCSSKAVAWTEITEIAADMQEGYYYLGNTISKTVSRAISHDVSLCLNGHNIETAGEGAFAPQKGATVTLTDCDADDATGLITGTTTKAAIAVVAGATFKMYGGTITGNTNGGSSGAGIIWLQNGTATEDGGAFYMYGGKIAGNTTKRGAVFAEFPAADSKPAIIQLLGGEITENIGTNTGIHTGGGAGVYAAVNVVVGGNMKVYGNIGSVTAEPIPNADIYLRNDSADYSGQLVISDDVPLKEGANIQYGVKIPDDPDNLQMIAGTPDEVLWNSGWVTYDGAAVKYKDSKFYTSADLVFSTHTHDDQQWISMTEETGLLPDRTGNYVLDADMTLPKVIVIPENCEVRLCLNGHTLKAASGTNHFTVSSGAKLTICDCTDKGVITGGQGTGGGSIVVRSGAELYLYAGTMTDNHASKNGGFVYLDAATGEYPGAVFYMYGGTICNNSGSYGAAVRLAAAADGLAGPSFIMEGGTICHNESPDYGGAIHAAGKATIELRGGIIEENKAGQGGGGLSVNGDTTVNLSGTVLRNNTATTWGGGVYIKSGTILNMTGGEISGNSAKVGAGVLMENTGTVMNLSGGKISGNKAGSAGGGGVYASVNTAFYMTDGEISNNEAEASGGGVALNTATASITGGKICDNRSANQGGGLAVMGTPISLGKVTISGNQASNGGGIYLSRANTVCTELVIDGAKIIDNRATSGGGIFAYMNGNALTMKNGAISGNSAKDGGGVLVQREITFTLEGGEISGNYASNNCGGVYASVDSTFIMNGGSITGNYTEKSGGGVFLLRAKFQLNGGTISYNTAKSSAGGVRISGARGSLNGTWITDNKALEGSGGGVVIDSTTMKVDNVPTRFPGYMAINGGCISRNTTPKAGAGLLIQSTDTLVDMYDGKITENVATKFAGGVYVGTGTAFNMSGGQVSYNVTEKDVAGGIRHDGGSGNYTGGEIHHNVSSLSGGGVVIGGVDNKVAMKNVKIYANTAKTGAGVVLQGQNSELIMESCEIYENEASLEGAGIYVASYVNLTANNCHIHDNQAKGNAGGVWSWATSYVYLNDCLIENNKALEGQGGAVWTRGDGFNIVGCTIQNNTAAGNGGGVCTGMMGSATTTWTPGLYIENTLIDQNTSGGIGGGLYISFGAQGTLRDVTFTGNTAAKEGGAFWAKDELTMRSVTATGNTSGGEGFAVYLADSNFDGHSYVAGLMQMSGNMKIHDNFGGDLYMGEKTVLVINEDGLGEDAYLNVTLHSGLLTDLVWGAYHYEGGDQKYTVTYGDRSMTDPELPADAPVENPADVEEPTQSGEKNEPEGSAGLFIGIGAVAAVIAVAAAIIVAASKKKKAAK